VTVVDPRPEFVERIRLHQLLTGSIESREADIGTYLQRARRRRDRFPPVSVVDGAVDDLTGRQVPRLGGCPADGRA
jgi:NADH dehydrogenase FAD-containing subunit